MASSNVVAEYWAWQKKQIQPRPMFALHDDGNIVPIENKVKKRRHWHQRWCQTIRKKFIQIFPVHWNTLPVTRLGSNLKKVAGLLFIFNRAQQYVHKCLEEQKARMGYVRAIIIKGRQQGMSAYVTTRFFHRAVLGSAITVYILAHESIASQVLFKKIETYYDFLPDSLRPKKNNATDRHLNLRIFLSIRLVRQELATLDVHKLRSFYTLPNSISTRTLKTSNPVFCKLLQTVRAKLSWKQLRTGSVGRTSS